MRSKARAGEMFQAIFRRRHRPRRPPPAKIRPGSPAPAMGPGTARKSRISPFGNMELWTFKYVSPARRAATNTGSAVATEPPRSGLPRLYVVASVRLKVWSYIPDVTPAGKPGNVGSVVATISLTSVRNGEARQQ